MGVVRSLFGGSTPPLRPKGAAAFAQPAEADRRALFWWLLRNTSCTAIGHNARMWKEFADAYEAWLRGLPEPRPRYVEAFKFVLDTQGNYEKGLARLRQGDHSVMNRGSSEGWLGRLFTNSVYQRLDWYAEPADIARIEHCPESMVVQYFLAHESAMACGHRGTYRGLSVYREMTFPEIHARKVLAALPFDTTLPEPRWDTSMASGARAPTDGIYEMVDDQGHVVGGMQYLVRNEETEPADFVEFGIEAGNEQASSFKWRLLWEDQRYKDGQVPDEEQFYPAPKPIRSVDDSAAPLQSHCESGHACPSSGYWFTPARAGSRRHFERGDVMPAEHGDFGTTFWQRDANQEA